MKLADSMCISPSLVYGVPNAKVNKSFPAIHYLQSPVLKVSIAYILKFKRCAGSDVLVPFAVFILSWVRTQAISAEFA